MSTTTNAFTPQLGNWDVTWGPTGSPLNFGLVDDVDPSKIEMITKEIKRGTVGDIPMGAFFVGLKGMLEIMVPDLNVVAFLALNPWMTAASDQVLSPSTPNVDMYTYAQLLNLHPHSAADQTNDLNLVKAVPMSVINYKRDGINPPRWKVSFAIYPDRAKLTAATPKLVYGWLGSTVPSDDT